MRDDVRSLLHENRGPIFEEALVRRVDEGPEKTPLPGGGHRTRTKALAVNDAD